MKAMRKLFGAALLFSGAFALGGYGSVAFAQEGGGPGGQCEDMWCLALGDGCAPATGWECFYPQGQAFCEHDQCRPA